MKQQSRVTQVVEQLRTAGRKAVIPYVVAGDPDADTTVLLMQALVEQGADIIELGMPFSDPSSDGPVIQLAAERALRGGMNLAGVLDIVRQFRERDCDTPIVLMGYLNPLEIHGHERFAREASAAGVDGLLIVDMPVTEADEWLKHAEAEGLDTIFLVAPTTREERLDAICQHCSGYIYYVSLKGVTGAALSDASDIAERIGTLRQHSDLPVMVGFGIKDEASARNMANLGDGVVVGSAIVGEIATLGEPGATRDAEAAHSRVELIGRIRRALDAS